MWPNTTADQTLADIQVIPPPVLFEQNPNPRKVEGRGYCGDDAKNLWLVIRIPTTVVMWTGSHTSQNRYPPHAFSMRRGKSSRSERTNGPSPEGPEYRECGGDRARVNVDRERMGREVSAVASLFYVYFRHTPPE